MNHNEDTILEQNEPLDQRTPPTSEKYGSNIFSDIFAFPWIPLKSSVDTSEAYHAMGTQGSVAKLLTLAIVNGVAAIFGLILIIGGNPYIDFAYDLNYLPFILAFILLIPASFLIHTAAHFLCFRAISGKGNLVAHGYLEVVSSTNILLLFWTAILVVYVTRMRGLDNVIIILGGLYILFPSVISLQAIHRISTGRAIVGFVLSGIVSIPLLFLYLYFFTRFREAIPYEINDWRLLLHFYGMFLLALFIIVYMLQQKKLTDTYPHGVPLLEPVKNMFKQRRVQVASSIILLLFIVIFILDFQYSSFYSKIPPYSATFLPKIDPNILFVYTKTTDNDRDYSQSAIELWDIKNQERLEIVSVPYGFLLRPNEDEDKLVVSHHWDPNRIFDPLERQIIGNTGYLGGNDPYNPTYNPIRNEFYGLKGKHRTGYHSLVAYNSEGERAKLNYYEIRGEIWAVAVHPSGEYIFVVGDDFVDTLNADTLELISSIRLGGKLRDVAISPDGKLLYVTDAVWRRIRIIPSPVT